MQTITVITAHNVGIEYKVASLGDRLLGAIIDSLITYSYIIFAFFMMSEILNNPPSWAYIVFFIPFLFYHLLCEIFLNGQSIGKKLRKTQVVSMDGSRPSIGNYLIRWLFRPIDSLFYGGVGILIFSVGKKGQRLGDLIAGTTVIKLTSQFDSASNPLHVDFNEDHEVTFHEAFKLSDSEIDLIDKALKYNVEKGDAGPANLLAQKLAEKMGVTVDQPTIKFLYTVKKDYNHLTS